jgi:hypothetical protein
LQNLRQEFGSDEVGEQQTERDLESRDSCLRLRSSKHQSCPLILIHKDSTRNWALSDFYVGFSLKSMSDLSDTVVGKCPTHGNIFTGEPFAKVVEWLDLQESM